jgi:hypothetical protein
MLLFKLIKGGTAVLETVSNLPKLDSLLLYVTI